MSFAVKIIFWIPCDSFIVDRDQETNNYLESFNLIHWSSIHWAYYRNSISRNNIILCCLGLFVRLWLSKGLFHIFCLAIFSVFFVLPLAFPPCIGQDWRRNTHSTSFRCPYGHILCRSHRGESLLAWAAVPKEPSGIVLGETTTWETKNFRRRWELPLRKYFL